MDEEEPDQTIATANWLQLHMHNSWFASEVLRNLLQQKEHILFPVH